jgi:hypothetical protein
MHGPMRNAYNVSVGNLKRRYDFGKVDVDGNTF